MDREFENGIVEPTRSEESTNVTTYPELVMKTMAQVYLVKDDELHFITDSGEHYMFYHEQDCCEWVSIEEIHGELSNLVGSPLVVCEETTGEVPPEYDGQSATWTFYRFATIKGYVTVRWFGSSNGYYSEGVDFKRIKE